MPDSVLIFIAALVPLLALSLALAAGRASAEDDAGPAGAGKD